MITALSAYKAMIEASAGGKSAGTAKSGLSAPDSASVERFHDADTVNISASQDVFSAVDSFYNVAKPDRFEEFHNLSRDDKELFVTIVAELAKSGYMGYEELVVDNRMERHELLDRIVDERVRGAKAYRDPDNSGR